MDVTQLFNKLEFHDSSIDAYMWSAPSGVLTLKIELCNFNQDNYDEKTDPETIPGELIFTDVRDIICDPADALTSWSKSTTRGIIEFNATPTEKGWSKVKLVLAIRDFVSRATDTHVITFEANDATWRPGPSSK
jgi:hypothetical protein